MNLKVFVPSLVLFFGAASAAPLASKNLACNSSKSGAAVTVSALENGELELPQGKIQIDAKTAKALATGDFKALDHVSTLSKDGQTRLRFRASPAKISEQTYLEIRVDSKTEQNVLGGCWATSDDDKFLNAQ